MFGAVFDQLYHLALSIFFFIFAKAEASGRRIYKGEYGQRKEDEREEK